MVGRNNSAGIHAWVQARLSEYLDHRLAASEHAQIEQHLRECAECRASFESLRWTIALVKQAPAPALPRQFTLPVPTESKRAVRPSFAFGFAQFATVLATLLLLAVIGVDVITQWGGGMTASAPSIAKQVAAPTAAAARDQGVATAPSAAEVAQPTSAPKPTEVARPTSAPKPAEPTKPPAPAAAPLPTTLSSAAPTTVPPAAAVPAPLNVPPSATAPHAVGGGALETPEVKGDATAKSSSATPALRAGFAITATTTIPAPTATLAPTSTATTIPPTATALPSPTQIAQARAEATRAPSPTQVPPAAAQSFVTPLRVVELGLLILAMFFGALVVVMWRRRQ